MANVTKNTIIKKAKSYIGTKESPKNSNNVIFNTHYYGRPVHGAAYPWCCVFLWDVFRLCGASSMFYGGKKCAYTPTLANWFKSKKHWHTTPKAGDIVFYQFPGSSRINHVGLVIEVINKTTIKTIEGNTGIGNDANGGCVMVRTRSTGSVAGYGRPTYKTAEKKSSAKKPSAASSSEYTTGKFVKDVEKALKVANPNSKATKATLEKTITLSTSKNEKHVCVKYVQKLLKAKGYGCKVTEKYDNQTASAVKNYQKKHKLPVDGVMNAKNVTWKQMLGL